VKRVLLVDDDPDILEALRQALEDSFEIRLAHDGAEAMATLEREPIDALVLDLMMPVLDGPGVLAAMRERGLKTPVVIVSAGADAGRVARREGIPNWFSKPFDLGELEKTLHRLVGAAVAG
jgi:DNA-binding response OmpR family regulator